MNIHLTMHVLGGLLVFLGAALLTPIPFALYFGDGQAWCFGLSAVLTSGIGMAMYRRFNGRAEVTLREGFAVVTFAWIGFALFGSLPFVLSGVLLNPVDALFESMSGFATAGSSVLREIESCPPSVLFWRAMSQWLGGMGFIVLGVGVLPLLGIGGMQFYQAEAPGPSTDRLSPRIQDTARLLWSVYALTTVAGIALLWLGEMNFYEAICHTFAAVATGGFSTRNASMGAFGTYSQVVTIVLMVVGGASFSLHYYALRGKADSYWRSGEFRFYIGLLLVVTFIAFALNLSRYDNALLNLRDSAFTVTSIITTTGFATADYEQWHVLTHGLLFALMFLGGCAGSTAGGLKLARVVLLFKHAILETARLIHPRRVQVLKLDHRPVPPEVMRDVLGFTVLFMGVFTIATLLLAATGVDLLTAGSGVVACMSTVGPGLGEVGPMDNYAGLPLAAKGVLCMVMLLGRLEIATVLVLLFGSFWRR